LPDGAFDQAAIDLMVEAYGSVCEELSIVPRMHEPANEMIALAVMGMVRDGERDIPQITQRVLQRVQPLFHKIG
jgi:hypothetical protein